MKVHALIIEEGCSITEIQLFEDLELAKYHMWNIAVSEFDSIEDMNETLEKEAGFKGLNVYMWPNIKIKDIKELKNN